VTRLRPSDWAAAQLAGWDAVVGPPTDDEAIGDDPVGHWAASGAVALTGAAAGPPLVPPGAGATVALGAQSAFAALLDRPAHQLGDWSTLLGERAFFAGLHRRSPWSAGGTCRAVACADGWLAVNLARDDDVAAVPAWVEGVAADASRYAAWELLDGAARRRSAAELAARAELLALPAAALPPAGEWVSRDRLVAGAVSAPVRRLPVASGPRPDAEARPLVVDLSALWAGPLCGRLLADAGARVVKVEWATRPDGARRGPAGFYDVLHAGQDSVALAADDPADRALLDRLLVRADIVIESARPRALEALGIEALDVCRRSATTWVAITAYGRTAPGRVGFGDDVAMAAGLAGTEAGGQPFPCADAIADPLTGMQAAVAALASFRSGGSRLLDVAMSDVVAATLAWSPSTATPARRAADVWVLDGPDGAHEIRSPEGTPARERAAGLGAHTDSWRGR
jgi:CoA-transferase family III